MRKLLTIMMALALTFTLVACTNEKKTDGMPNPMTEFETAEEINGEVGSNIKTCDGAKEESFFTISCADYKIAQYKFDYDEVSYMLGAAITKEDISGVWPTDFDGTLGETIKEDNVMPTETADGDIWARWYSDDMQYFLYASDVTLEDFTKVYDLVK